MCLLLERTQSSYFPAFHSMHKDVMAALDEARDIYIFLKPLQRYCEEIEETDFAEVPQLLGIMFHLICLVWANSEYYQQPARLVVLLQELSNLMIEMVSQFLYVVLLYLVLTEVNNINLL